MGRRRRIDVIGGVHHVMNRGVNHQAIFFGDGDRIEFGRRLADIHRRFNVETLAYCLMGNHYHLLLRTPDGGLSEAMHRLGFLYTRHTNDRVGRDGPLFRSRFHSIHVTTDDYLLMAVRYIHRNALDIAGIGSVGDYRWSSYQAYVGLRQTPSFVRTDIISDLFGGDIAALADFHASDDGSYGLSPCRRTSADVEQLVEFVLAGDDLQFGDDRAPAPRRDRTLLVLMLEHFADADWSRQLEDDLAFASPVAKRMALSRARRRRDTDPAISRAASALVRLLATQGSAA